MDTGCNGVDQINAELYIKYGLEWMCRHREHWVALNYPNFMFDRAPETLLINNITWMLSNRPEWMIKNHPEKMANYRPHIMFGVSPYVVAVVNPEWVARHEPRWTHLNCPDIMLKHNRRWLIDNRTTTAAECCPCLLADAHPQWMCANQPHWMAINRPHTMLLADPAYMMTNHQVWMMSNAPWEFLAEVSAEWADINFPLKIQNLVRSKMEKTRDVAQRPESQNNSHGLQPPADK